jgi:NADH dehydrogenase
MKLNVPESKLPRIVIVGAGFAGLKLARKLNTEQFQVVLIDKNNYHQFQPLLYQVASSGVEASSISFPLRQIFQKHKNVHVRLASFSSVDTAKNVVFTSMGSLCYDHLIICTGIDTNYYGMQQVKDLSFSMKSVTEAVQVRNAILENFENALMSESEEEQNGLMSIAVIGGGPTGVELSGALAEMKRYILPKDYPELNFSQTKIYLVEASDKILGSFSESSIRFAKKYLKDLGVELLLNSSVKDYDGKRLFFSDGRSILIGTLIWAAGVKGNEIEGLLSVVYAEGGRIKTDDYNKIVGYNNIYALGDIALMKTDLYPKGHPQVAQVAIQQAKRLANNFNLMVKGSAPVAFKYKDSGSMATVGRNKAVVQLPFLGFHGFLAWLVWAFVHLMAIVGVKNRLQIFINWAWNYVSYNKSFRLIYKFKSRNE